MCVLIVVGLLVPPVRVWAEAAIGFISASVVIWAAVVRGSSRRVAWLLIAVAIVILTVGEIVHTAIGRTAPHPFPTTADFFTWSRTPCWRSV